MPATPHTNDDLFHALAARARGTSDGRLVLAVLSGLAAALGMVMRIARICSVVLGTCAAIFAVLVVLGRVLGTWIS